MTKGNPLARSRLVRAGLLVGGVSLLAGCTTSPPSPKAAPAVVKSVPLALTGCANGDVPSGFVLDASHSGTISPAQYSASGDIQASLLYDQYRQGLRNVFTDLATPAPDPGGDQIIECVAMQFSSPTNANRFLQSFEYLRSQAGSIVQKVVLPASLKGDSVGYQEQQQAFTGYHIASTTVMEVAVQNGDDFYDVSVAGPAPTVSSAFGFLKELAAPA